MKNDVIISRNETYDTIVRRGFSLIFVLERDNLFLNTVSLNHVENTYFNWIAQMEKA